MKIDKKALGILKNYIASEPENTSQEDFNYAKEAGLMFYKKFLRHDDVVVAALAELKHTDKNNVTNLFLASLSTQKLFWRIGLPTYVIMHMFPRHSFHTNNVWERL